MIIKFIPVFVSYNPKFPPLEKPNQHDIFKYNFNHFIVSISAFC